MIKSVLTLRTGNAWVHALSCNECGLSEPTEACLDNTRELSETGGHDDIG